MHAARNVRPSLIALALATLLAGRAGAQGHTEIVVIPDQPRPAAPALAVGAGGVVAPLPASGLAWADVPNDAGRAVTLTWTRSPSDDGSGRLRGYAIERAPAPGGPWTAVDSVGPGVTRAADVTLRRDTEYFYRVTAFGPGGATPALSVTGPVTATSSWFDRTRGSVLALTLLFVALALPFLLRAPGEHPPPTRRLAGLEALGPAVAGAAASGRPVLVLPGSDDVDELQTVAGMEVVEHVARLAAQHDAALLVPVSHPLAHALAEERVRAGFRQAGRDEPPGPERVRYVSPEQFAYGAAVAGLMARERPGAVVYAGAFHGESLLLAETGAALGAVQVAATANVHALPAFVATCDHTLVGEELFAAGAVLSGDPRRLGALQATDLIRLVIVALVLVGCALETAGVHGLTALLATR